MSLSAVCAAEVVALPDRFDAMIDVRSPAELRRGAQTLDLEGLAGHRCSVLGAVPGRAPPSQKRIDTLCWQALRGFDPARPVFVEGESRKIGTLRVPETRIEQLREQGQCLRVAGAGKLAEVIRRLPS